MISLQVLMRLFNGGHFAVQLFDSQPICVHSRVRRRVQLIEFLSFRVERRSLPQQLRNLALVLLLSSSARFADSIFDRY